MMNKKSMIKAGTAIGILFLLAVAFFIGISLIKESKASDYFSSVSIAPSEIKNSNSIASTKNSNWSVSWYETLPGLTHREYVIAIQNQKLTNEKFNLSVLFDSLNFNASFVRNINIFEWKNVSTNITDYTTICSNTTQWDAQNSTWYYPSNCSTLESGSHLEWKLTWKKAKDLITQTETKDVKRENYAEILIDKIESKQKDDTENGTKFFKLTFDTPIIKQADGTFGSSGKVAFIEESSQKEYHPWFNISYGRAQNITVCNQHDNNITESGYTANITFNHSDYVTAGWSQADGDDIRIAYRGTELDRVLSVNSSWNTLITDIQFKVQTNISAQACDSDYEMYFNSTDVANPPSNIVNVFWLADDFEDNSLNATMWTFYLESNGNITESSGRLRAHHRAIGSSTARVITNFGRQNLYVDFVDIYIENLATDDVQFGIQNGTIVEVGSGSKRIIGGRSSGGAPQLTITYNPPQTTLTKETLNYQQNLSMAVDEQGSLSYWNNTRLSNITDNYTAQASGMPMNNITLSASEALTTIGNISISEMRARIYITPEPNATLGTIRTSNTAPVVQAKTLTPASPSTTDNLICTANITDADGSAKLSGNLTFFRNNIANYSFNQSVTSGTNISVTLGEGNTTKDEAYICQVDAYDGTAHTPSNTSSVTIGNTASEIRDIAISPTTAYTNSSLNCSSRAYDVNLDSMTVNITWYNGSTYYNSSTFLSISNGSMASLVLANSIQGKGETWNCSVFANDGTANSALNSTTRTISNLNPMITKTEILPSTVYKTSNLTTNITAQEDDLDLLTCFFLPFKDNIPQTSLQKSFTGITNGSQQIYNLTNTSYNKDGVWLFQEWCNDSSNANSSLINTSSKTIQNSVPTTPEIGGVENNTRVTGNSQTLRCANSTDADSDTINYVFYGDTTVNPTALLQNTTGTTYTWSTADGSTYYWRCKAEDSAGGVSGYTEQKTFTENTKPPIVIMTSPSNNSRTIGNSANIQWNSSTDAEGDTVTYELLADTSNPPTTSRQNTTGTSYTLATSDGSVYFTRIKVQDGYETAFGLISTFTENTAPTLPDAGGFINNSRRTGNSVTLRCENSTDAQSDTITYAMYFDTNANPTTLIQNTTGTTSVQATTDGSAYYYKCKSQDGYETSAFTGIINFTENTAPPVPTLSLPTNNSRVNATTLLTVNSVTDAEGDTVYYSIVGDTAVNPTALLQNTTGTTYNWTLTRGNSYYWRVKGEDNYEASAYSSQFNFTSNSLPVVTVVAINPSTAYTNSTLNCSANFSDAEPDKLNASFIWKNGTSQYSSITINNIASTNTNSSYLLTAEIQARGENWSCEVNAYDSWENSTTVMASEEIANTAPAIDTAVVINVTSATRLTLAVNMSSNSSDGDADARTENFRWYINNISTNRTSSISNKSFVKNDVLIAEMWVNDTSNANSSLVNSSSLTISNSAPPSVTLYFNDTNSSSNLPTFNWSKSIDNADGDAVSYIHQIFNSTDFNTSLYLVQQNSTGQNYTLTKSLSDGKYYWRVLANDTEPSNSSWSDNFTMLIDTVVPEIAYGLNTALNVTWYNKNWIFVNVTINETNLGTVLLEWMNVNTSFNSSVGTNYYSNATSLSDGTYTFRANVNDTAGNYVKTAKRTVYIDTTYPILSILSPLNQSYDLITLTLTLTWNYTEKNYSDCFYSLNKAANMSVSCPVNSTTISVLGDSSNEVRFYMNDSANNLNSTTTTFYVTKKTEGAGGGGGSSAGSVASSLGLIGIDPYLCQKTYDYILKNGKTSTYIDILKGDITVETGRIEGFVKLETYINNWQILCSNTINRTLEPKLVCEKIYYFIIGNNYSYTNDEIFSLRENLSKIASLSVNLINHYIDNYDSFCYDKQYSGRLPSRKIQTLTVADLSSNQDILNLTKCDVKTGSWIFDISFPFIKIPIGNDLPCWGIELWRTAFAIKVGDVSDYQIVGIKIWGGIAIVLIIVIIRFLSLLKAKERSYN